MANGWGESYRERRIAAGLTQDEAARLSGVSQQAISKIERGVVSRSWPHTVDALERALEAHIVLNGSREEVAS